MGDQQRIRTACFVRLSFATATVGCRGEMDRRVVIGVGTGVRGFRLLGGRRGCSSRPSSRTHSERGRDKEVALFTNFYNGLTGAICSFNGGSRREDRRSWHTG